MESIKLSSYWIEQRAYLNHDILCNQVLTELSSMRVSPKDVLPRRLAVWLKRVDDYRKFITNTPDALDASTIIDDERFNCWPNELKITMRPIFRELFWATNNIHEKTNSLLEILEVCAQRATVLINTPQEERTEEMVGSLEAKMLDLSHSISALPRLPIRVVPAE